MRTHENVDKEQVRNIAAANPTFLIEWYTLGKNVMMTRITFNNVVNALPDQTFLDVEVNEVYRSIRIKRREQE